MPPLIDLTGRTFRRLTVMARAAENDSLKKPRWVCRCSCGSVIVVRGACLVRGTTKSCGCWERDFPGHFRHGGTGSLEYEIWCSMKKRCRNPRDKGYPRYGGRGIKYCDRWELFDNFIADMGAKPAPRFTLERIDNDGDYCPENCRWASYTEQARNRSTTRFVTSEGQTKCLSEWAADVGANESRIRRRLNSGWTPRAAIHAPWQMRKQRALQLWPESP